MTDDVDSLTPAELGRWLRGVEARMAEGFDAMRKDVAEVRAEVRGLSFVRSDVYASDQRARDLQVQAIREAAEARANTHDHRIGLLWGLFWALLTIIVTAVLGVVIRLAGAFA
jgi:hypothetical protein